jgi:hypothetical protein
MKRALFSLIFIFLTVTSLYAQKLQYGLRFGLGFASQSIDNPDILSTNSVTTYNLGAVVDIPFKKFDIEPGISIVGKGVKQYQNSQTNTITLTYLDVPVNAVYKIDMPTVGKVCLGAGPYFSIGLSGNNQEEGVTTTSGTDIKFGASEDYRKIDMGINFSGALDLNNHLTFQMRYSLGLNNIASDDPSDVNTTNVKNRLFSIGLGFWF